MIAPALKNILKIFVLLLLLPLHIYGTSKARHCTTVDFIQHSFTYIPPSAFKGGDWTSEHDCVYQITKYSESEKYDFQFESPKSGCLHDPWDVAYGKLLQNNVVTLQYHIISNDTLTDSFVGFPSGPNNCDFLDVFAPVSYTHLTLPTN